MYDLSNSQIRLYEKLHHDLGENILDWLNKSDVTEVMLNPDGKLWIDHSDGLEQVGTISKTQALAIINSAAGSNGLIINYNSPQLETELPYFQKLRKERFTAQVPPIVAQPSFTIRKKSQSIYDLAYYYNSDRITKAQYDYLQQVIAHRKNIVICGGPGSGKTTFANALIESLSVLTPEHRIIILEDLPEIQCSVVNKISYVTSNTVNMRSLLKTAMRMRPDRILVGEVRGAEALDMLKAWNTGCPGGICTVHANGCEEAIQRLADLAMESGLVQPPTNLIEHTVNVIIFVNKKNNSKGFVEKIVNFQEKGAIA